MRKLLQAAILLAVLTGCNSRKPADLLVTNAVIYSVDSSFSVREAMAIRDGRILATGTTDSLMKAFAAREILDAVGRYVYTGLIDAHCHFYRYGLGLQTANLTGTKSWRAILDSLQAFSKTHTEGWLVGRGWDQNDWEQKEYPGKDALDSMFPDRPVILTRIDGHAAIANTRALEEASIKAGQTLTGGDIEVKNGQLTGILIDNAVELVSSRIPAPDAAMMGAALLDAQANCFAMGLTTVDDCGLDYHEVQFIDSMQRSGQLKMRIYAMLSDAKKNYEQIFARGKIKTDLLNVRSFKVYADGALGSRGACLLEPYSDRPGHRGFLLSQPEHFDSVAALLYEKNFQMCTHAIGDSGNRTILQIYSKYLKGANDRRWRIEHAQVVHPDDFNLFGQHAVIPSVQPTHATSDMYWAGERLGSERVKGAYAYKDLLDQNNWIPLGTDFPVEDISPFKTFLSAVARVDASGFPEGGYQKENALSREQALRGMTIWAAKSNFEEAEKGSLEAGKFADFVILNQDLMKIPEGEILKTRVEATYVNGQAVYKR